MNNHFAARARARSPNRKSRVAFGDYRYNAPRDAFFTRHANGVPETSYGDGVVAGIRESSASAFITAFDTCADVTTRLATIRRPSNDDHEHARESSRPSPHAMARV